MLASHPNSSLLLIILLVGVRVGLGVVANDKDTGWWRFDLRVVAGTAGVACLGNRNDSRCLIGLLTATHLKVIVLIELSVAHVRLLSALPDAVAADADAESYDCRTDEHDTECN